MKRRGSEKIRDFERTRREILQVAFLEVYAHGFQGVSVDSIVNKTSLTKGAFYHHFGTKLKLGYSLVDEVIAPMIIERWIRPLSSYENPLEGILAQLESLIGNATPSQLKLGCPLNNLIQEMAPIDQGFKRRLRSALRLWIGELDKELKRGARNGFLRAGVDTRQVAQFVVMAHEGFYGLLKGLDDPQAFRALYGSLQGYFTTIAA